MVLGETQLYRFHHLPWGLISAPFILNAVIQFLYKEYATKHPESAKDIEDLSSTTYVDDIIAFGVTEEDILRKMRVAIAALSEGQMVVTKFRSHPKTAADT